jgi:hypothetical protein
MRRLFRSGWVWIAAAVLLSAVLFGLKVNRDMVDFGVNYAAGDRLVHGETLYRVSDEHYQFKYAPFCAMIYAPLSMLPPTAARAVWFLLVLAATGILLRSTIRLLGPDDVGLKAPVSTLLASFVLAKFFFREIQLGQINAIVTALLMIMAVNMTRDGADRSKGSSILAGLLWGLATALKPYALIFLPYFILKRRWNILWPALLVLGFSLIAPAAYYGFDGNLLVHEEWISSLSRSTPALLGSQDNVSLLAMFSKWFGNPVPAQLSYGITLLILILVVFLFVRRGRFLAAPTMPETALLLLLIPLISPLGVALIIRRLPSFPVPIRTAMIINFAVIGLSLYDLMGRKAYSAFMAASVLTLNFLLLVGVLVALRWTRKI